MPLESPYFSASSPQYVGLDLGRYPGYLSGYRTIFGVGLLFATALAIFLADSGQGEEHTSPWPAYLFLVAIYGGMQLFDFWLLKRFLIPSWIYRWKTAQGIVVQMSLISGVLKGRFLEQNANWYMEKELASMGDPLDGMR